MLIAAPLIQALHWEVPVGRMHLSAGAFMCARFETVRKEIGAEIGAELYGTIRYWVNSCAENMEINRAA
jgi:hypothetical protein